MATGTLYKALTDIVSCEICFELLEGRRPRQLSCSHVFCEQCIEALINDAKAKNPQSSGVCCPVCKQTTDIPGGSAASLPPCFYVSKVQRVQQEIEERHKVCKMCRSETHKADITTYCFACSCGYCQSCGVKHEKAYQNHPDIRVTPSTISYLLCSDHDSHFAHFCLTCGKAICSQCYMADHMEHKVYEVSYDGERIQQNVKEILYSSLKSADQKEQDLVKLEDQISQDVERTFGEMTHRRDHLIQLVKDQYEALCLDLTQKRDDIKSHLIQSKKLIEDTKKCIHSLLKQVESWDKPVKGIPEGRIRNISELIADVQQQTPSLDLEVKPQSIKFVSGEDDLTFGTIVKEGSALLVVSRSCEGELSEAAKSPDSMSVSINVGPRLLYKTETPFGIRDLDYLSDRQLVVCWSDGLCVYDSEGRQIKHYLSDSCKRTDGRYQLTSLCVDRNVNIVLVTEDRGWHRPGYVHVYSPDGDTWKYHRLEVCKEPQRVAVSGDDNLVVCGREFVGESRVSKLYKYDSKGRQIWSVDMSGDKVSDLSVDDSGQIFVCLKDKVCVYNKHGQHMSTLSTADRQLKPGGVCVNKNGEIFVSDQKTKKILLFDKSYKFVTNVIELDFEPEKMALSEGRLAVADWRLYHWSLFGRCSVSVYEL